MRRRVLQLYNRVRRCLRRRGVADGPPPLREIRVRALLRISSAVCCVCSSACVEPCADDDAKQVNHPYYDEDGEVTDGPWFCGNAVATAKYNVVSFIPR